MMKYVSEQTKTRLANEAVDEVRNYILTEFRGSGRSTAGVYPIVNEDSIGIGVLDEFEYLHYQDKGFETFVMHSLSGKCIPIANPDGSVTFRVATRVGEPDGTRKGRYVRRDPSGELYVSEEPRTRWTHPGLMPRNFMEDSVNRVLDRHRGAIKAEAIASIPKHVLRKLIKLVRKGDAE